MLMTTDGTAWTSAEMPQGYEKLLLKAFARDSSRQVASRLATLVELQNATASNPIEASFLGEPNNYAALAYAEGLTVHLRSRSSWDFAQLLVVK